MLAPLNHAFVRYEGGGGGGTRASDNVGVSAGDDDADDSASGGTETGGFFFSDGGQETEFAAALRIRVGEGNRDWPLTQVCFGVKAWWIVTVVVFAPFLFVFSFSSSGDCGVDR